MQPRDWLLLFIAYKGAPDGLDPVRLQKGMFLLAMEGDLEPGDVYEFVPYNYGPMSRNVYLDLDRLEAEGLVERTPVARASWDRFRATRRGRQRARDELLPGLSPEERTAARHLYEIKQDIATKTFAQLLTDVYDRYPAYAGRSVFRTAHQ